MEMTKKDKGVQSRIFGIRVWHDRDFLHGIEVDYVDQRTRGIFHRSDHKGPAAHKANLIYSSLVLKPDDWIVEARGFMQEEFLRQITIVTAKGESLVVGVSSGTEVRNVIPEGASLLAVAGSTKTHLESLYFVYTL